MPAPDAPRPAADQAINAEDRDLLVEAARRAGEIAMRNFRTPVRHWAKSGGKGPVSEADLAIDAMLCKMLLTARPEYGWLSEESEDDPARMTRRRVFIVDPIDGTRAFIEGQDHFTISIAVADAGAPVAAAVFAPARNEMYSAVAGAGSVLNGEALATSTRTELSGARALMRKSHLDPEHWRGDPPPLTPYFLNSLAYRLCLVGAGRFDAMLTLWSANEWDVAAGDLIAREAGALATSREGAPLRYNKPAPRAPGVIVAPPALHAQIFSRLSRLAATAPRQSTDD